jgi:WS/DGAT C-terminal domain
MATAMGVVPPAREAWGLPLLHEPPAPVPHTRDARPRPRRAGPAWRHEVAAAIPVGCGEGGNMTVYFEVLSHAGVLTIALIFDPDHGPDLDDLTPRLQNELDSIIASP